MCVCVCVCVCVAGDISLSVFFSFFKVFIEFITILFLCFFLFMFYLFIYFFHETCGILARCPGIKPAPFALEGIVFTTGPPGKSPLFIFMFVLNPLNLIETFQHVKDKVSWRRADRRWTRLREGKAGQRLL